jgi:hypothetical protein
VFINGLTSRSRRRSSRSRTWAGGRAVRARHHGPARGRVPLRLLVPRGRREPQPPPVDQPADGDAVRRADPRRADQPASPGDADAIAPTSPRSRVQVDELDAALRTATATIPKDDRLLLTYHDAYAYFAEEYGWTVLGAVQPSSFDEPTPREVADLVDQVELEVPAIFGSEVFPSPVLEQIAAETGAATSTTCATTTSRVRPAIRPLVVRADAVQLRHDGRGARRRFRRSRARPHPVRRHRHLPPVSGVG